MTGDGYNAFVLAAGLGTRLRPLTLERPKPLLPVCGVPLLAYTLALCARHELRRVVVNAHWLAEQVQAWAGHREGVAVAVSVEYPEILGTGGGLRRVREYLAGGFAVVNGDVLCDVDLGGLVRAVPRGGAAMALRSDAVDASRYGVVAADDTGHVVELAEVARAKPEGRVDRTTHFTGIHAMDSAALEHVPDGFACVVRTAYRELVPKRLVMGLRHPGTWLDIGDPEAYLAANLAVLDGRVTMPLDPHARAGWSRRGQTERGDPGLVRGVTVRGSAWVGLEASIGRDVTLEGTTVGERSVVESNADLRDCVVWDGARVPSGKHERTVFTPRGMFRVS